MNHYFGIYGFEITRPISAQHFTLLPRFLTTDEAHRHAVDRVAFHLTAIGEFKSEPDDESLFDLTAALTFCQQQWVATSQLEILPDGIEASHAVEHFTALMNLAPRRESHGEAIGRDAFRGYERKRSDFVNLCLEKLADTAFNEATGFRPAFYRHVESWRLYQPFGDLTYYLDFTALEILARTHCSDPEKQFASLATELLNRHGFDLKQDNPKDRVKSVQTYAHLRNALFHNGKWEARINENGQEIVLKLNDYEDKLRRLVPDLLLRMMGYNDDHINWNRWLDRMPFG